MKTFNVHSICQQLGSVHMTLHVQARGGHRDGSGWRWEVIAEHSGPSTSSALVESVIGGVVVVGWEVATVHAVATNWKEMIGDALVGGHVRALAHLAADLLGHAADVEENDKGAAEEEEEAGGAVVDQVLVVVDLSAEDDDRRAIGGRLAVLVVVVVVVVEVTGSAATTASAQQHAAAAGQWVSTGAVVALVARQLDPLSAGVAGEEREGHHKVGHLEAAEGGRRSAADGPLQVVQLAVLKVELAGVANGWRLATADHRFAVDVLHRGRPLVGEGVAAAAQGQQLVASTDRTTPHTVAILALQSGSQWGVGKLALLLHRQVDGSVAGHAAVLGGDQFTTSVAAAAVLGLRDDAVDGHDLVTAVRGVVLAQDHHLHRTAIVERLGAGSELRLVDKVEKALRLLHLDAAVTAAAVIHWLGGEVLEEGDVGVAGGHLLGVSSALLHHQHNARQAAARLLSVQANAEEHRFRLLPLLCVQVLRVEVNVQTGVGVSVDESVQTGHRLHAALPLHLNIARVQLDAVQTSQAAGVPVRVLADDQVRRIDGHVVLYWSVVAVV
ncbi:hypothetical protein TYRP_001898 [Tyrophagus putrescentiae]|nr:hypothetical protein TYRP_001898 [Tyrophagus putrescentiae]